MKSLRRILHTLVILLAVCSLLTVPASAKTTRAVSYAQSGYSGIDNDVFTPVSTVGVRMLDMTAPWDFTGDVMHVKRQLRDGRCTAYAILDTDECAGKTVFTLDLANDLSIYNVICFGVGFTSLTGTMAPVRAELELADAGGNRVTSYTVLTAAEDTSAESGGIDWSMLYFDISGFDGRSDAARLKVTLTYDPDSPPNVIRISNPYAAKEDRGGFDSIDQYLTASLKSTVGVFGMKSGAARPDERGQVRLSGSFVLAEQPKTGADVFLEIELSRFTSGGLTVGIGYENGEAVWLSRIALTSSGNGSGSEVFTVPVDAADRLQTMELHFDNMVCDTYFKIEGIRLYYTDETEVAGNPAIGKVTDLRRDGENVFFSGVMDRKAVKEYSDTVLRFYAVSGRTSDDLHTAVEIGQTKVSTRFGYTADLSAYPYLADTYRFFAGIRTEEGEILPLSAPVYPGASDLPVKTLSNVGLYDAASVGVFESNASHVIVDVPLDRLFAVTGETGDASSVLSYTVYETGTAFTNPDGSTVSRGERPASGVHMENAANVIRTRLEQTPMNHALLRSLDSEINFYMSAGIEVYLRLTSETVIDGLTYTTPGAGHYSVVPETPYARNLYTALVRFLCLRYGGIAGFVTGSSVNVGLHTGYTGEGNTASYAKDLAELCRITYNAAADEIEDIVIVLPFGEAQTDKNTVFRTLDPKTLSVMTVTYLENMGTVPWVMMYCADDMADILGTDILYGSAFDGETSYSDSGSVAQRSRQLTGELGLDSCAAVMYYYEPSFETTMFGFNNTPQMTGYSEYLAEMFAMLCGSTRARAVFLSLDQLNDHLEHDFYSCLKSADGFAAAVSAGTTRRLVADFSAVPSEEAADRLGRAASKTDIWNFTDQFHPLGWIAGGGVSSCLTVYSDLFSEAGFGGDRYARVLRSVISVDEDSRSPERQGVAAGIALRNLTRTVDLSEVDYLEFTFAMNHPGLIMGTGHESGTVTFIVGSDDCRAEFSVRSVAAEQVQRYVCDLRDYEFRGRVDYMGIMVYADHEVYLDLSSVTAYSKTLSQPALEKLFAASPAGEGPEPDHAAIVLVAVIVFVFSVSAAVLLIRYDIEEHRERQKRLRSEKRPKHERIRRT